MADVDLTDLYTPSKYSKSNVAHHLEVISKKNEEARSKIPNHLDIPYGPRDKQKIDIFGTDLPSDSAIFVFIHGGYWQEECIGRTNYHYLADILHKKGVKSIFIGYSLCPAVTLPEIVQEVEVAMKKCLKYAKDNKSRAIYVCGYSAGAHLAALLFTKFIFYLPEEDQGLIRAVFLIAGIYDLSEIPRTFINEPLKLDIITATEVSPQHRNISAGTGTAFHVIAAEKDSPVFQKQAKLFHEKLLKSEIAAEFHSVPNVDHFEVVELLNDDDFPISQLISKIVIQ